jgi:hypothetical protein
MTIQANITSLHVLDDLKAALAVFLEEGELALSEAEGEVRRAIDWLARDCQTYWQNVIRKKQEEVTVCKSALFRKQITPSPNDQKASVVDEKKALQKATMELEDADKRLKATKKWAIELERQYAIYKGAVQPFSASIDRDLPHAIARVTRMIRALDDYLRTPSPDLREALDVARESAAAPSMRRTGDDESTERKPAAGNEETGP